MLGGGNNGGGERTKGGTEQRRDKGGWVGERTRGERTTRGWGGGERERQTDRELE